MHKPGGETVYGRRLLVVLVQDLYFRKIVDHAHAAGLIEDPRNRFTPGRETPPYEIGALHAAVLKRVQICDRPKRFMHAAGLEYDFIHQRQQRLKLAKEP